MPRQTFYKYYRKLQTTGTFLLGKRGPKNPQGHTRHSPCRAQGEGNRLFTF
jgi:hypothetical protein